MESFLLQVMENSAQNGLNMNAQVRAEDWVIDENSSIIRTQVLPIFPLCNPQGTLYIFMKGYLSSCSFIHSCVHSVNISQAKNCSSVLWTWQQTKQTRSLAFLKLAVSWWEADNTTSILNMLILQYVITMGSAGCFLFEVFCVFYSQMAAGARVI